ncbi:MAG TPA: NAD(P)-dependent oxidoreductase, partial [Chloroflexota bacterium]|nr:NAD(P)-dependent oxidoreductase [Chloroflexota bacterium]
MRISVLGLGRMGTAIAVRLLDAGYDLTVWNRTPGKDADLVRHGAESAPTIAGAIAIAEVVMTSLTADAAVKEVYLGENGILASLGDRTPVLVDVSTISPATSREVANAAPPGKYIQAPILGGPDVAEEGKARLLLDGNQQTVESLDDLWNHIAAGYVYTGPNGTASSMKLLSNLNLIAGTIALADTVAVAERLGFSPDTIRKMFGTSPAIASGVRVRMDAIVAGDHAGWWTIKLAEKDIHLALEMAKSVGLDIPLGNAVEDVLKQTDAAGFAQQDLTAVVEVP